MGYVLLTTATILSWLVVGIFVFLKRPQTEHGRLLLLLAYAIATHFNGTLYAPGWALHMLIIAHSVSFLFFGAGLYFFLVFPQRPFFVQRLRGIEWVAYLVPAYEMLAYLYVDYGTLFPFSVLDRFFYPRNSVWDCYLLCMLSYIPVSQIYAWRTAQSPAVKQQAKWLLYASSICCTVFLLDLLPFLSSKPEVVGWFLRQLTVALFPLAFAIAIVKHRLFDIDLIIRRSLVYSILTVAVAGVYFGLAGLLSFVSGSLFASANPVWVMPVSTLAAASAFSPLRHRIQLTIDRTFYRERYNAQLALLSLSRQLATVGELEALSRTLVENVSSLLHARSAAIVTRAGSDDSFVVQCAVGDAAEWQGKAVSDNGWTGRLSDRNRPLTPPAVRPGAADGDWGLAALFHDLRATLLVPLNTGDELVGVLSLGERLSEQPYQREDAVAKSVASPREVLREVNAHLYPRMRPIRMFVTAFYGVLDVRTGAFWFASAGQGYPLLCQNGRAQFLKAAGMPLGALRAPRYGEHQITLAVDDALLLYSDGFVEAHGRGGQMWSYERFRYWAEELPRQSAEQMVEDLFMRAIYFIHDREERDDLTLVVVRRKETSLSNA
jgi:hypothetical protein